MALVIDVISIYAAYNTMIQCVFDKQWYESDVGGIDIDFLLSTKH